MADARSVHRTTRHHRCDYEFLELLQQDFGIPHFALQNAFMGVPPEPKKEAIALCEWAVRVAPDDPARALLSWARKYGRGTYHPAILEGPELTYEYNDYLRSIGSL